MVRKYIPKQGDIVFLDFTPTKGHEQMGYRPAVVLSNDVFNKNTFNKTLIFTDRNNPIDLYNDSSKWDIQIKIRHNMNKKNSLLF